MTKNMIFSHCEYKTAFRLTQHNSNFSQNISLVFSFKQKTIQIRELTILFIQSLLNYILIIKYILSW